MINLLGVYHYEAHSAIAECTDLFGSGLPLRPPHPTREHCARRRSAGCSTAKNPSRGRDAHTDRRKPREADAESQPTGAVHGGQPIAHSEHRDDCGGLRLRRSLYRSRAQPDLARNRGRRLRRGIGHGNHADCPGHLTRFARRDPHPRLRRPGGDGAACPERRRGQVDRRSLSLCAERPPLGFRQWSTARLCRNPAGRGLQGPQ